MVSLLTALLRLFCGGLRLKKNNPTNPIKVLMTMMNPEPTIIRHRTICHRTQSPAVAVAVAVGMVCMQKNQLLVSSQPSILFTLPKDGSLLVED